MGGKMRGSKAARFAVLACLIASLAAAHGARADDAGVITFDGMTPVLSGFSVRTVLFDNGRFGGGAARYRAFGVLPGSDRLALTTSDDGLHWSTPQAAFLKDSTNVNIPFVLSDSGSWMDVVWAPGSAIDRGTGQPFQIFYEVIPQLDPVTGQPKDNTTSISSLHVAVSSDGVTWTLDQALAQTGEPVIAGGASGWKIGSYGPTDVVFQSSITGCLTSAPNFPWNCRYAMVYDAYGNHPDGHARSFLGLAGSADGLTWTGRADPALCPADPIPGVACAPSATSWDTVFVTHGHVRKIASNKWELYYGGAAPIGSNWFPCNQGSVPCWSGGVATSTDGVAWTKAVVDGDPAKPAIDRAFLEAGSLHTPYTIVFPQAVDDQAATGDPRAKIYYSRVMTDGTRGMLLAHTGAAPTPGPSILIASPQGLYSSAFKGDVVLYLNDSSHTLLLNTLQISIDGNPVTSWQSEPSTVGATLKPGFKIVASAKDLHLLDGLHNLLVSVRDDGPLSSFNPASATTSFTLDTLPPSTTLGAPPPGVMGSGIAIADPGSLGTFRGVSADQGDESWTKVVKIRAIVTNPMGQVRQYDSSNARGWWFTPTLPSLSTAWRWVSPSNNSIDTWVTYRITTLPDTFWIPGTYTVTFLASDLAGNSEPRSSRNTLLMQAV